MSTSLARGRHLRPPLRQAQKGEGKRCQPGNWPAGDALHAVAQQADDAALEVDAFDAIELDLRPVMPGQDLLRTPRWPSPEPPCSRAGLPMASSACSSMRAWFLAITTWLSSCRLMSDDSVSQTSLTSSSARPGRVQRGRMTFALTVTLALAMAQPPSRSA